jgi:ribosome-associated protein
MTLLSHPETETKPLKVRPSRTLAKRSVDKFRDLATLLVDLPAGNFARIDLPADVREALELARRLATSNARRRQLQYVTGLLEQCDTSQVLASLSATNHKPQAHDNVIKRLLEGGDDALFALSPRYSPSDMQILRLAVRQARKSLEAGGAQNLATKKIRECMARLG